MPVFRGALLATLLWTAACGAESTPPPKTTLLTGPDAESAESSATFTFEGTAEAGLDHFECRLDQAAWTPCTSPHTRDDIEDGARTFEVRGVDTADVADPEPPRWVWQVDTVASPATSDVAVSAPTATADGEEALTVSMVLRNHFELPIPGVAVALDVSGTGHTVTPAQGATDADGALQATLTSTVAEDKVVWVSADGVVLGELAVTFVPGPVVAETSTLTASEAPVADGVDTADLVVALRDAHGNGVPGIEVVLDVTGTGNTLGASSGTTDAVGELATTLTTTVAELKTVTASAGELTLQAELTAVAAPPAAAVLVFTPDTVTTDGAVTLTATLHDALGNPTPDVAVAWSATGGGNVWSAATGTTDPEGVVETTLGTSVAGDKTVTLTAGALEAEVVVTFEAGTPVEATSSISATGPATADGTSVSMIEVVVRDAEGNPVPDLAVVLGATGGGNLLGASAGTTDDQGMFATTLASTVAEAKTVTADVSGLFELEHAVTFEPGLPSAATSTLTAAPGEALADGVESVALELTVRDSQGNVVPGAAVVWTVTGGDVALGQPSGTTDTTGALGTTLTATKGGHKTVTATADGVAVGTVAVPFSSTTVIVLGMSPANPDAGHPADLTVTIEDHLGQVLTDYEGAITLEGSGGVYAPSGIAFTAADGGSVTLPDAVWAASGSHVLTASWPDDGPTTLAFSSAMGELTEARVLQDEHFAQAATGMTVTFTLDGLLPADGVIEIETDRDYYETPDFWTEYYPPYDLDGVVVDEVDLSGAFAVEAVDTGSEFGPSSRTLRLHRSAATDATPGTAVTVRLGNVVNPPQAGGRAYFSVRTTTSDGRVIDKIDYPNLTSGEIFEITEAWLDPRPSRILFWAEGDEYVALTDHVVVFTLPRAPGMSEDFSDLLVRDPAGDRMPHWVEEYDADSALVWTRLTKVPQDPRVHGNSKYMEGFSVYFGDPTAPDVQSFAEVFPASVVFTSDGILNSIQADSVEVAAGVTLTMSGSRPASITATRIVLNGVVQGSSLLPGPGAGAMGGSGNGGGASYGGLGGIVGRVEGGWIYGTPNTLAIEMGSTGAAGSSPGSPPSGSRPSAGGSALTLTGMWIEVHGEIRMGGHDGYAYSWDCPCGGGGSGGGVMLVGPTLDLDGALIDASGGLPGNRFGGGGGGGRVKLFTDQIVGTYTVDVSGGNVSAFDEFPLHTSQSGFTGSIFEGYDRNAPRYYGVREVGPPETR